MITDLADAVDVRALGGKAVQLGQAIRAGLPVPGGFAMSPATVEAVARGETASTAALARVCTRRGLTAVRSSALDEDSAGASFAGAHLSVLGVSGLNATIAAVRAVHASGAHQSAQEYRSRLGLDLATGMAVVVQRLIDSDVAGVLFTRNPVSRVDERVVEASWGLGESVVAGLVTPDRYRVARGGRLIDRTIGDKDMAIRPAHDAQGGAREVTVSSAARAIPCLGQAELTALDALASLCDRVYDSTEHDIEFAFHRRELFLLQRRPITGG